MEQQIESTVSSLRRFFGTHATKEYDYRIKQLKAMKEMLTKEEKTFQEALKADLNKPEFEGVLIDMASCLVETEAAISHLSEWMAPDYKEDYIHTFPSTAYVIKEPLGVVLVISAYNYPVQLALGPAIAAIAAGNCVLLKPSELSANTSKALATLIPKYLDQNSFRVVEGAIPETTHILKQRFDHIVYTGSEFVGKIVMKAAAEYLTPVTLELGGKSPTIIDETADLAIAVRRVAWGRFMNAGQTCVAPDYVLVADKVKNKFLELLNKELVKMYGKDPKESKDYARIVNERHMKRLAHLLEDVDKSKISCGGDIDMKERYIAPTVLKDVSYSSNVMQEEIFGPILPVFGVGSVDEAIEYVNQHPKPLALYIFSNSSKTKQKILKLTSSGGVSINDTVMHVGHPDLPFGGVGSSGTGAYHGKWGFDLLSHHRGVLEKSLYLDAPQRYPPYNAQSFKIFRFALSMHHINFGKIKRALFVLFLMAAALMIGRYSR